MEDDIKRIRQSIKEENKRLSQRRNEKASEEKISVFSDILSKANKKAKSKLVDMISNERLIDGNTIRHIYRDNSESISEAESVEVDQNLSTLSKAAVDLKEAQETQTEFVRERLVQPYERYRNTRLIKTVLGIFLGVVIAVMLIRMYPIIENAVPTRQMANSSFNEESQMLDVIGVSELITMFVIISALIILLMLLTRFSGGFSGM